MFCVWCSAAGFTLLGAEYFDGERRCFGREHFQRKLHSTTICFWNCFVLLANDWSRCSVYWRQQFCLVPGLYIVKNLADVQNYFFLILNGYFCAGAQLSFSYWYWILFCLFERALDVSEGWSKSSRDHFVVITDVSPVFISSAHGKKCSHLWDVNWLLGFRYYSSDWTTSALTDSEVCWSL